MAERVEELPKELTYKLAVFLEQVPTKLAAALAMYSDMEQVLLAFYRANPKTKDEDKVRDKLVKGTQAITDASIKLKSCIATYNATFYDATVVNKRTFQDGAAANSQLVLPALQTMLTTVTNLQTVCGDVVVNWSAYLSAMPSAKLQQELEDATDKVRSMKTQLILCGKMIARALEAVEAHTATIHTDTELKQLLARLDI